MAKLTRRHLLGGAASGVLLAGGGGALAARHGVAHGASSHLKRAGLHAGQAPAVLRRVPPPKPVIMLDPGHGGKDPGAIGVSGTYEKHIAVAAATELHNLLMASGKYDVVLSRKDDRFIPLAGRVELAHRHKADLFISMHADALHQSDIRGASVYTLSGNASDRQTAMLAETENSADRFAGPGVAGVPPDVEAILNSLVHEETRRGSAHMAASVIRSFQNRIQLLHHPSRHAAFRVLKSGDIPSVLVEMGFMSNHLDEQALRRAAHRTQITQAMKQAIDGYFLRQRRGML
ncbi:N-acetylmuramoyl-L-alanine amidase family protein [Bombella favorum]|uniref:N-acetylmuramoyl-L-alanine amidase n=1 Tax=Bombella favorum TaxID=2039164 RepID=A0ABR5ZLT5_9PROT|nr:N-acetylmuramoyl-L-alanine amidase [Bombella favorum]MBA5725297.1 N-acetylmuramoyl-L-alanine amidase [Bombella favorum]